MAADVIDYRELLQEAILGVVRRVLQRVEAEGLPGEHHFYLTLSTTHPGVLLPSWLLRQHPEQMTVILQNQFWDLEVGEEAFSVTLRFGGQPARLTVPFAALRAFVDPSAELGLKLGPSEAAAEESLSGDRSGPADVEGDEAGSPGEAAVILPFEPRTDR